MEETSNLVSRISRRVTSSLCGEGIGGKILKLQVECEIFHHLWAKDSEHPGSSCFPVVRSQWKSTLSKDTLKGAYAKKLFVGKHQVNDVFFSWNEIDS